MHTLSTHFCSAKTTAARVAVLAPVSAPVCLVGARYAVVVVAARRVDVDGARKQRKCANGEELLHACQRGVSQPTVCLRCVLRRDSRASSVF